MAFGRTSRGGFMKKKASSNAWPIKRLANQNQIPSATELDPSFMPSWADKEDQILIISWAQQRRGREGKYAFVEIIIIILILRILRLQISVTDTVIQKKIFLSVELFYRRPPPQVGSVEEPIFSTKLLEKHVYSSKPFSVKCRFTVTLCTICVRKRSLCLLFLCLSE